MQFCSSVVDLPALFIILVCVLVCFVLHGVISCHGIVIVIVVIHQIMVTFHRCSVIASSQQPAIDYALFRLQGLKPWSSLFVMLMPLPCDR